MEDKTIKEIYNCRYSSGSDVLEDWYNKLIDKTPEELSLFDILRMIRQDLFLDEAIPALLAYLIEDPRCGDICNDDALIKLSEIDTKQLKPYRSQIEAILKKIDNDIDGYEWCYPEEKDEFLEVVSKIKDQLKTAEK